ncbi:hypothetical protein PSTG_10212 [Puccinia striiformis f. sp. tritici PST-78]|uniref:Carnitine O-acetyltransferase, mitochondrial n=1 Tax=Puccinia striiformis f. sp. tritici PST-78 TaxID=1165861 RepID=A0A0L0VB65_9BASI|nr:hypothetical protein PSTG_10212 [Puccinia striiformis f. sp. tritici PST-78]
MPSMKSTEAITYRHQDSLPQIPLPDLESTVQKYLKSILPLVSPQEPGSPSASDAAPTQAYKRTKANVEDFLKSPLVKELQNRLKKRAEKDPDGNWVSDLYTEWAYLGNRLPLIPISSYYVAQKLDLGQIDAVKKAAGLIRATLEFRNVLESERLEPDFARSGPLCMDAYRWLFNSCRYPSKPSDYTKKFDPRVNNHLAVIRKGRFFEFSVIKPDGSWLSQDELESQLEKVIQLAGPTKTSFPLGALTTQDRDTWADARAELCNADPRNSKSLERIESSIICVALDDAAPITRDELGLTLWSGDGKNRFFDKQQLIVCENGRTGFTAEHSRVDGTTVARMNEWIVDALSNHKIDLGTSSSSNLPPPSPIEFALSDTTKQNILKAIDRIENLGYTLDVLEYPVYGRHVIKTQFKTSPDALAQLVFQLGYYKLFGRVPVTWEPAHTRRFKRGRTEGIRSCSIEALEWCKDMENDKVDWTERLEKFKLAVRAHLAYSQAAGEGQGIDRHLLALRLSLEPGEEIPALFQDPVYKESIHWTITTSHLPSERFDGFGYGSATPDGFGLAYSVNKDSMRFTVTTPTDHGSQLKHFLQEAADDVLKMMKLAGESSPQAKL